MTVLTSTEARNCFADLIKEAEREVVQITQHNKPAVAVISWELYESLMETLEILSDPETLYSVQRGEQNYRVGQVSDWEQVKKRIACDQ
jgi:prevent-host-death family protein